MGESTPIDSRGRSIVEMLEVIYRAAVISPQKVLVHVEESDPLRQLALLHLLQTEVVSLALDALSLDHFCRHETSLHIPGSERPEGI